jgi:hypothetical protein
MTSAVFRRRRRSFVPVDQESLDLLDTVAEERDVVLNIKARRNPKHHRLFFAVLKFMVEHTRYFETVEKAKTAIKIATGEVDTYIDSHTGKTFFILRSISWGSMDQSRFSAFFDRAVHVIANRWMPAGTTEESVRAELEAMIEPNDGRAAA